MSSLFTGSPVESNRILYTPSEFARTNLLHLQEIGQLQAKRPHTNSRSKLNSYLFFVVKEGSGTLHYDGKDYELNKDSIIFIDCYKPYSHTSSEDLWALQWAHFYGPNMNGIYGKYVERGGKPCFKSSHLEEYVQLLEWLHNIAASNDYIKDMKIFEKLSALLTLLMEDSWADTETQKHLSGKRNLQDVKDYIDKHFTEKITLDELAELFYINKFYLTRVFKEQFGMSISQYIMQLRITMAKRNLRFTTLSIEEIAAQCGLEDANYFSRVFRKVEGVSPGEYRKQW